MARRDRYSRWNRLPPVYRSGEHKIPGPEDEAQRIILYLKGAYLDLAERLAEKAGAATVQEYCAELLATALEVERVKHHVAEIESKRGTLEGFREITHDLSYLAEWQEQAESRDLSPPSQGPADGASSESVSEIEVPSEVLRSVVPAESDAIGDDVPEQAIEEVAVEECEAEPATPRPTIRIPIARPAPEPVILERVIPEVLDSSSLAILWSNVDPRDDNPQGFLPALRRGQPVPPERVTELLQALGRIEADHRGSALIERSLSYALHRLSLESQVLLTEAWPGVFDQRTVAAIRSVQESVERILAGQEIRRDHNEMANSPEVNP